MCVARSVRLASLLRAWRALPCRAVAPSPGPANFSTSSMPGDAAVAPDSPPVCNDAMGKATAKLSAAPAAPAAVGGDAAAAAAAAAGAGPYSLERPQYTLTSDFLADAPSPSSGGSSGTLAVIVLNWTLPALTPRLWDRAWLRVVADGGANRLHDELPRLLPREAPADVRRRYRPCIIKGDLDSIRPDVLGYYRGAGVEVVDLSHDQYSTDLQKCITYVRTTAAAAGVPPDQLTLVALGALGGRLDHTLSNISTLHACRDVNLVLCGEGNLTRLVRAGATRILPDRAREGPTCGLLPTAGPAVASSRGLRWNLDHTPMRFGGLVSSSNIIDGDEVLVESDVDLLWTTELCE